MRFIAKSALILFALMPAMPAHAVGEDANQSVALCFRDFLQEVDAGNLSHAMQHIFETNASQVDRVRHQLNELYAYRMGVEIEGSAMMVHTVGHWSAVIYRVTERVPGAEPVTRNYVSYWCSVGASWVLSPRGYQAPQEAEVANDTDAMREYVMNFVHVRRWMTRAMEDRGWDYYELLLRMPEVAKAR